MSGKRWKDHLEFVARVNSTNDLLKKLHGEKALSSGKTIFAFEQFQGRGQAGNTWQSQAEKNLTFSFYLQQGDLAVNRQFDLNMIISLGICDYLSALGLQPQVKWPNDIIIDGSKIAGVLIENSIRGNKVQESFIGIGLNLNQSHFSNFRTPATSVFIETGHLREIRTEAFKLVDKLQDHIERWPLRRSSDIREDYQKIMYARNEFHCFSARDAHRFFGVILGVEPGGHLIVQDEEGRTRTYGYKEIHIISGVGE